MQHPKLRVSAIQRLCIDDGPGVRTVVFLKGCYLSCPWCCNPEMINYGGDLYFDNGLCINNSDSVICRRCVLHGGAQPKESCLLNSYEFTYRDYDIDELFEVILRDKLIFDQGGGVTFSGGEPLFQSKHLQCLLEKLKKAGVHIAVETTLYAPPTNYSLIKEYVDFWLIDVKFAIGYFPNGNYKVEKDALRMNLRDLQKNGKSGVSFRMVFMSEGLKNIESIKRKLIECGISNIELLPYHNLAENKYKRLKKNMTYFHQPTKDEFFHLRQVLESGNISSTISSIIL